VSVSNAVEGQNKAGVRSTTQLETLGLFSRMPFSFFVSFSLPRRFHPHKKKSVTSVEALHASATCSRPLQKIQVVIRPRLHKLVQAPWTNRPRVWRHVDWHQPGAVALDSNIQTFKILYHRDPPAFPRVFRGPLENVMNFQSTCATFPYKLRSVRTKVNCNYLKLYHPDPGNP
jgi:hypothetical protein